MQELIIICPCCGHRLVLPPTDDSVAVKADEIDMIKMASNLGIELGALKGGEEIGD